MLNKNQEMSWGTNFNIPPTISEVGVDERLQQQQQQQEGFVGLVGTIDESDDAASSETIQALQSSKLEPLMISVSSMDWDKYGDNCY